MVSQSFQLLLRGIRVHRHRQQHSLVLRLRRPAQERLRADLPAQHASERALRDVVQQVRVLQEEQVEDRVVQKLLRVLAGELHQRLIRSRRVAHRVLTQRLGIRICQFRQQVRGCRGILGDHGCKLGVLRQFRQQVRGCRGILGDHGRKLGVLRQFLQALRRGCFTGCFLFRAGLLCHWSSLRKVYGGAEFGLPGTLIVCKLMQERHVILY